MQHHSAYDHTSDTLCICYRVTLAPVYAGLYYHDGVLVYISLVAAVVQAYNQASRRVLMTRSEVYEGRASTVNKCTHSYSRHCITLLCKRFTQYLVASVVVATIIKNTTAGSASSSIEHERSATTAILAPQQALFSVFISTLLPSFQRDALVVVAAAAAVAQLLNNVQCSLQSKHMSIVYTQNSAARQQAHNTLML
jgi:hypothetical protein